MFKSFTAVLGCCFFCAKKNRLRHLMLRLIVKATKLDVDAMLPVYFKKYSSVYYNIVITESRHTFQSH